MYFGICLKRGDDANMTGEINPKNPPKWLPYPNLEYNDRLKQVKEYVRFSERLDHYCVLYRILINK